MTEQGQALTTEEPQTDEQLSTADLASAGRHPSAETGSGAVPAGTQVETRPTQEASSVQAGGDAPAPLFSSDDTDSFRSRWMDVQSAFVDDPRAAVQQGDALVAEVMQRLADLFARERSTLEDQWDQGGDVSTEDLRVALQRYRSFFDRLLSV